MAADTMPCQVQCQVHSACNSAAACLHSSAVQATDALGSIFWFEHDFGIHCLLRCSACTAVLSVIAMLRNDMHASPVWEQRSAASTLFFCCKIALTAEHVHSQKLRRCDTIHTRGASCCFLEYRDCMVLAEETTHLHV